MDKLMFKFKIIDNPLRDYDNKDQTIKHIPNDQMEVL